jgi:hypothetical protein
MLASRYADTSWDEVFDEALEGREPAGHFAPRPCEGQESFVFISYSRADLPRLLPYLQSLDGWGYALWYDQAIPGGAEWHAMIEEKISRCSLLLAFLSKASVKSKWVRREIEFADALNKPILGVHLETVDLAHGLQMLLHQYQMLTAADPAFPAQLRGALEYFQPPRS